MSEDTLDDTNVIDTAPVEPESTPEQDNSPDPEVSDDAAQSEIPEQGGSPAKGAKERIQQLVGDKKAAMEYGEFWRQKFEEAQKAPSAPEPEPAQLPSMPKLEEFDYDQDAWNVALEGWNDQLVTSKVKAIIPDILQQNSRQAAAQQVDAEWQANVAKFSEDHEDFANVAFATQEIYDAIKVLPDGPAIAYHLGQNPNEAARIGALSPERMTFELGRLPLSSEPAVARKQVTNAPEPISPVGGQQPSLIKSNETIEDFMARRNAEEREKRSRR